MSFAYVSSPVVPTIRPRNLSGVGTVFDAGRWSTSSVVMRGSCRYRLISAVYAESFGCCARALSGANVTAGRADRAARIETRRKIRDIMPPRAIAKGTYHARLFAEPHSDRDEHKEYGECPLERCGRHLLRDLGAEVCAQEQPERDPERWYDAHLPFLIIGP